MKTKTRRCQFQLKIMYGHAYYIDRVPKLEAAICRKPRTLQIKMIGTGEVPPDWALLIRSVLLNRSPNANRHERPLQPSEWLSAGLAARRPTDYSQRRADLFPSDHSV